MNSENRTIDPRYITVDTNISLTLLTGASGTRLTKRFHKDEQGQIVKVSQPQFYSGEAETIKLKKLSDIQDITDALQANQCIATGIFDRDKCLIVTKKDFSDGQQDAGSRTRSKEHMKESDFGLALLDYDQDQYMPEDLKCNTPEEFMAKLVQAVPELEGVGYSAVGSSSNGIFDEKTGEPYQSGGGMHIYIAVKGIKLEQLQELLKVRLWNAGLGYISFARNGAMLKCTIIDLSVLSQERLVYEARPVLGEGIGQKERVWMHKDGNDFTGGCPLTDEEIDQYKQRVVDARQSTEALDISEELQNSYRNMQVDRLVKEKDIRRVEAEKQIPKRSLTDLSNSTQRLELNESVEIDGQMLLVSELLERGEELHGKAMPDPVEGSDYGSTTAMFYNNDGENPCIHSFATA